jgi:LuxR family transcriptional regulator, maltose regulon positive regulatory protein
MSERFVATLPVQSIAVRHTRGLASCDDRAVGSAGGPESGIVAVASPGAGGVVPRAGLFGRLGAAARVTVVSAPAGSGKTVLLRSWIGEAGLADRAAWVPAGRDERDPQRFWGLVLGALRQTVPGSGLVRELTAAPDLDGWAITERLLRDLAPLAEPVWLVVDDVHLLGPDQALRQLELLMMRAPDALRFVLATRHDLRLGLHRLRLEGQLAEIRADDLRFSLAEARDMFQGAGVLLPEPALKQLYERTEGWAAGLRLAALSLAGHPDPGRFAAEFSGSERTVAEYLLAEVLDRQSEEVRRLLLRTSVLERVSGPLADALAGGSGGERVLQELEVANAFVVALDAGRSWFRYHHLFADLLQLELRRAAPGEVTGLHCSAAGWFAEHGLPVEAIRHAQAARDWGMAARLLADHWSGLRLSGQAATVHAILAGFPAGTAAADAELAAMAAADELAQGSLEAAERYLEVAARQASSVPADRRGQAQLLFGMVRLLVARQRGNLPAVAEEARKLQAMAEAPGAGQPGLGEELRALALVSLGIVEIWAGRFAEADRHLEQGVLLARLIGRPFLEFTGLAYQAPTEFGRSFAQVAERARQAVELAERHGWTDEPAAGSAYTSLAAALAWQGRPGEAEPWVQRAERTVRPEADPATAILVHSVRGLLELARGRDAAALATYRAAERLSGYFAAPHYVNMPMRGLRVHALVRLGDTRRAEQALAGLGNQDRDRGEIRVAEAVLRLAQDDPRAAAAALAPVLDRSAPVHRPAWLVQAFLLEAIARDALSDPAAARRALERALDLAEPDRILFPFLLYRVPGLLERHARDCARHAALVSEILTLLPPPEPGPAGPAPDGYPGPRAVPGSGNPPRGKEGSGGDHPPELIEPLSRSEMRVLRYLPTNLSAPEIARELSVSVTTVRTHIRHLFAKLGAHRRTEAVARARDLGVLAPSPRMPPRLVDEGGQAG